MKTNNTSSKKRNSNHTSTPADAPISFMVQGDRDGRVSPHEMERAKQAFGLQHDSEIACLQRWWGNSTIVEQHGPFGVTVMSHSLEVQPTGMRIVPIPQLQIVSESPGFLQFVNEVLVGQKISLVLGDYQPGKWVGGILLSGQTRSMMLCFNPLSPMTRGLLEHWRNTDEVSLLFGHPFEGALTEEFRLNGATTISRMLALSATDGYVPDRLDTWMGMWWLAAKHNDPNTVYLVALEETDLAIPASRH